MRIGVVPVGFTDPQASNSSADTRSALVRDEEPPGNSRRHSLLWFLASRVEKPMTDRKVLALASPALRRDVARPTLFRQAKRVNKQRVSQKTVERLISEGLVRWGNASRTFMVLTDGDEPDRVD